MKKPLAFATFLFSMLFFSQKITAQYYFYDNDYLDNPVVFEIGGSFGLMNCLTDVGGHKKGKQLIKDRNFGKAQLAGSIYLSALYKNTIG
jgi:hypothetical protein